MSSTLNDLAKRLRTLHIPGDPLILTNVWSAATSDIAASRPETKTLATASFAIAAAKGVADEDLSEEDNLIGVRRVTGAAAKHDLPVTADAQHGYEDVGGSIKRIIEAGAVGANLEDLNDAAGELRTFEDSVIRVKQAVAAAVKEAGVPDFCLNARTDVLALGGTLDEAIERGHAYLAAGALTVYVWGGRSGRGVSKDGVRRLVKEFGRMVNVKMNLRPGFLNGAELAELGVARVRVGPEMFHKAMEGFRQALDVVMERKSFE